MTQYQGSMPIGKIMLNVPLYRFELRDDSSIMCFKATSSEPDDK